MSCWLFGLRRSRAEACRLLVQSRQLTFASPGECPRSLSMPCLGSCGGTALVLVYIRPCMWPPRTESVSPSSVGSCIQALLTFRAQSSGGLPSSRPSDCLGGMFLGRIILMGGFNIFGVRAPLSLDVCHLFPRACWLLPA